MTYGMGRQLKLEATDKLPFHLLQGFETGFVATVGTESVTVAAAVGRQMFLALKLSAGDAFVAVGCGVTGPYLQTGLEKKQTKRSQSRDKVNQQSQTNAYNSERDKEYELRSPQEKQVQQGQGTREKNDEVQQLNMQDGERRKKRMDTETGKMGKGDQIQMRLENNKRRLKAKWSWSGQKSKAKRSTWLGMKGNL